ncbi:MAG TPA: transglycosylase SLT domain-containing protein [Bryobacteraceae bacterium]|nr:transglycosylase SLT domain-containing protein [Bryobacteraceae bacterium]
MPDSGLAVVPAVLPSSPAASPRKLQADELAREANQRYRRGQRDYQAKNIPQARAEFDAAVDLLLSANATYPDGRTTYQGLLDNMVDSIHRFDLAGMGAAALPEENRFEKAPLEDILEMTFPVDPKLKDRVRDQVAATSSQLPLTVNDAVLGYIEYFSNRGRKSLIFGLERSGRYQPMIARVLDEAGLPPELIHLAQAESGFIPRAMSRKAAGGMWQFLAERGAQYGLVRNAFEDERMDPEKATRAAAHHLHDLYQEFGDWYLAMAAYNCGPVTVEKAVERTGYADFWELRRLGVLPAETTNYVPIILAMTIMEKNAAEYGLQGVSLDGPLEYDTVEVSAPTSLGLIADLTDTPETEIDALNPAILKNVAPVGYSLHVPKGVGSQLMAALQQVPEEHRDSWRMRQVGAGETLASIGRDYGVTAASIVAANGLKAPEAAEGDRLLIPAMPRPVAPARRAAVAKAASSKSATRRAAKSPASRNSTVASKTGSKAPAAKNSASAAKRSGKAPVILARAGTR